MAASSVLHLGGDPLPGLGYPPLAAFDVPVTDGFTGAHYCNSGLDIALKNFAGGNDASVVGTPVEHDGYMTLGASGYIQTDVAETAAQTILVIGRRPGALSCGLVGTYQGASDPGIAIYGQTEDYWKFVTGKVGTPNPVSEQLTLAGDINEWQLLEVSVPATGNQILYNHRLGTQVAASLNTARVVSGRKFRIGRLFASGFGDPVDVAAALFYDRQWSPEERGAMIPWARQFAAENNIGV